MSIGPPLETMPEFQFLPVLARLRIEIAYWQGYGHLGPEVELLFYSRENELLATGRVERPMGEVLLEAVDPGRRYLSADAAPIRVEVRDRDGREKWFQLRAAPTM